jgi:hypothetical protein
VPLIDPARRLTCLEINKRFAKLLVMRLANQNVLVIQDDATRMSLPDRSFDRAIVLHHAAPRSCGGATGLRVEGSVSRAAASGTFAGADSLDSFLFRLLHIRDTMVLVDPATFPRRLAMVGFEDICVEIGDESFRFVARRPLMEDSPRHRLQSSSCK